MNRRILKLRRTALVVHTIIAIGVVVFIGMEAAPKVNVPSPAKIETDIAKTDTTVKALASTKSLDALPIKGRAPMTGYSRDQFSDGWAEKDGCDMRDIILNRDLKNTAINDKCQVTSGVLNDPYTGKTIQFTRGVKTSAAIQIDHVVAIGDAWQTGAQQLSAAQRKQLYNDPLELLAVDGPTNEKKGDGDAATWLPPNKAFRCQYVQRQIQVKQKYHLWVTSAEHNAMANILKTCAN